MQLLCDMLIVYVANGDGFDDDRYGDVVGFGDEYGGFGCVGLIYVCKISVGKVLDLSKGLVCGAMVKSIIIVDTYESLILDWIGGYWYGTWVARGYVAQVLTMEGYNDMFLVIAFN